MDTVVREGKLLFLSWMNSCALLQIDGQCIVFREKVYIMSCIFVAFLCNL